MTGRNFDFDSSKEKELMKQINSLQKQFSRNTEIGAGEESAVVKLGSNTEPNQYYRIFYNLQSTYQSDSDKESLISLELYVETKYDSQFVDKVTIVEGEKLYNREIIFKSEGRADEIRLVKKTESYGGIVTIGGVKCYHLSENPQQLQQTLIGIEGEKVFDASVDDSSSANKFKSKDQFIGSIITPKSDFISGIDFRMKTIGSGGENNYSVIICNVDEEGNPLTTEIISRYYFAQNYLQNLRIGVGLYHFPISAEVEKNNNYFIGISNHDVNFNLFNTLAVYGSENIDPDNNLSKIVYEDGKLKEIGKLYYRIYEPMGNTLSDSVLSNAIIQDVGGTVGFYDYSMSGQPRDIADIYSVENGGTNEIYFDNSYSGLVASTENNLAFIYKFDSGHPIDRAKIELSQVSHAVVDSLVYYSIDGTSWSEIEVEKRDSSSTGSFSEVIDVSRKSNSLYVKITYNNEDKQYRELKIFGIQALNVHMDLFLP